MKLTTDDIKQIIKVARKNPKMTPEDVINITIESYSLLRNDRTKTLFSNTDLERPAIKRPIPYEILTDACIIHGMSIDVVRSKSKEREYVRVRQQYSLIARLFKYSFSVIGDEIYRGHDTIIFARNKALGFCKNEQDYCAEVSELIDRFPKYRTRLIEGLSYEIGIR